MRTYADWLKKEEDAQLFASAGESIFLKINNLQYSQLKIAMVDMTTLKLRPLAGAIDNLQSEEQGTIVEFEVKSADPESTLVTGVFAHEASEAPYKVLDEDPVELEPSELDKEFAMEEGIGGKDFNQLLEENKELVKVEDVPMGTFASIDQLKANASPELKVTFEGGIPVFETKTYAEARDAARKMGLKYDQGQMFKWERPWQSPSERKSPWNYYELYTEKRPLDIAYEKARKHEIPFKGSVEDFHSQFGLSFEAYLFALSPELTIGSQKDFPNPSVVKKTFVEHHAMGFASDPPQGAEKNGVNLRSLPYGGAVYDGNTVVIRQLQFGESFFITAKSDEHDWYKIRTNDGLVGYVVKWLVLETPYDKFGFKLYQVQLGDTAMKLASKFFGAATKSESDPDMRNYVNALFAFNNPSNDLSKGVYRDDKKEVQVKLGLRIWIPSSRAAYDYIQGLPASQRHGGRPFVERIGEYAYENNPFMWTARYFLTLLETSITEKDHEQIGKAIQKILGWFESLLTSVQKLTAWIDMVMMAVGAVLGSLSITAIVALRRLLLAFMIGYIKQIRSAPPALLGHLMLNYLKNVLDWEYLKGIVTGLVDGVYQWGKDLVDMVGLLLKFAFFTSPAGLVYLSMDGTLAKWSEKLQELWPPLSKGLNEMVEKVSKMSFMQVLEGVVNAIDSFGESLGSKAAIATLELVNATPYKFGHTGGFIIGYLLPDILLTVATSGGWAAKWIAKPIQYLLELVGKIGQRVAKAIEGIAKGLKYIDELIEFVAGLAKGGTDNGLVKAFTEFFEGLRAWLIAAAKATEQSSVLLRLKQLGNVTDAKKLEALMKLDKVLPDELLKIFQHKKTVGMDQAAIELLIQSGKVKNTTQLLKVLENGKVASLAQVERLLASTKVTNLAQLERLLKLEKVESLAEIERILRFDVVNNAGHIEIRLVNSEVTSAARLEDDLLKTNQSGDGGRLIPNPKEKGTAFSFTDLFEYQSPFPIYSQMNESSCVAASCRTMLGEAGGNIPEAYLREAIGVTMEGGALNDVPKGLATLADEMGFAVPELDFMSSASIADLSTVLGKGPAMVSVKTPIMQGARHALVVDKIENGLVFIRDPLPSGQGSSYAVKLELFQKAWEDIGKMVYLK